MIAYRVFILKKYDSKVQKFGIIFSFLMNELNLFFVLYFEAIILNDSYICLSEGKIGQDHWSIFKDHFIINVIIK